MKIVNLEAFVPAARATIEKYRDYLMKGPSSTKNMARDEFGMAHLEKLVCQSARNLALYSQITDSNQLDKLSLFFADNDGITIPNTTNTGPYEGLPNAQAIKTVSAIDIGVKVLIKSLIPVTCMERELADPAATVTWLGDKAKNDAGGFKAGETVFDPTTPESPKLKLDDNYFEMSIDGDDSIKVIELNNSLFKGFLQLKSWDGSSTVYSEENDDTNGKITALKSDKSETYTGTINYDAGTVTFDKAIPTGEKLVFSGFFSRLDTPNAKQVLRVTQTVFNKHVEAKSVSVIGEMSIETMMYINKVLTGSQNVDLDNFYKDRLVNLYTIHVNNRIMELAFMLSKKYKTGDWNSVTLDYTNYSSTIEATVERKYDGLQALVIAVDDKVRRACNHKPTAYIVGSKMANLMQGDKASFIDAGLGEDESQNGLIGSYNKVPVYRNNYIDEKFDAQESGAYGYMVAVYRRTDGEWAPFIYAEFLGLFITGAVQNYDNPAEIEQALFCQVAIDIADEKLCQFGRVKMTSSIAVA